VEYLRLLNKARLYGFEIASKGHKTFSFIMFTIVKDTLGAIEMFPSEGSLNLASAKRPSHERATSPVIGIRRADSQLLCIHAAFLATALHELPAIHFTPLCFCPEYGTTESVTRQHK
jgi:hypothetical protein